MKKGPTPKQPNSRPRARIRARAILVAVGLAFGLLLGEIGLRMAGFTYVMVPERIEFGTPNPQQLASGFLEDQDLFWVSRDYFSHTLPHAKATAPGVVFMGCSCTHWGMYPALFERMVDKRRPGRVLSFANFGVAGYTTYQGLRQLERDVLPLEPRVVTLFYGWNDHWLGPGITDEQVSRVRSTPLLYAIQRNSRVYQLLIKGLTAASILQAQESSIRVPLEAFEANLTQMVRSSRSVGVIPVLLTAPTSHVQGQEPEYLAQRHIADLSDLVPLHQGYVEVVRRVAAAEGAVLCDLARAFEGLPPDVVRRDCFQDDGIHLLPLGDEKIAEFLFDCFEASDLFAKVLE